jgi:uncharacterized protein (DUF983 family)
MKCTRKTEDSARKIVMCILGGVIAIAAIFTAIVFTKLFITLFLILVSVLILIVLMVWLSGDLSFCKGESDERI